MIPKEKITNNFIYKHFNWQITDNKSNVMVVIIGRPGIGKSTVAQKICADCDPTFNINRVVYDTESFLKLFVEGDPTTGQLKAGQAVLFDEIVNDKGAESRSSMSKSNKTMTYINANFRVRRLIVVMCLPSLMMLDKNLREVNVTAIIHVMKKDIVNKVNSCKFFWCDYNPMTQFFMREYPRLRDKEGQLYKVNVVKIGLPPRELEEAYEAKKMEYLEKNLKRWLDAIQLMNEKKSRMINPKEIINVILNNRDKYMVDGRYNSVLIGADEELGIGQNFSRNIATILNKQEGLTIGKKVSQSLKTLNP